MEIQDQSLVLSNKLTSDYIYNELNLHDFFHYSPFEIGDYENRMKELSDLQFPREELVRHLISYNQKFNPDSNTLTNINKLLHPKSAVVIGGQQAGLLTGPLYTIYKIITILQQAQELEGKLNIPIVPVFWIAGEDHDFDEVNHIYSSSQEQLSKITISHKHLVKNSLSHIEVDKRVCESWLDEVFTTFGETIFTKELIKSVKDCLHKSLTYVDFFGHLIHLLFNNSGIVLIDSGNPSLRKVEHNFLQEMVLKNEQIDRSLKNQQQFIEKMGYKTIIQTDHDSAHLFYHLDGKRVLLERSQTGDNIYFRGKNNECIFSKDELLHKLEHEPERFSNNVVTRPVMQDFLFPTISFIAGPGEVAYWAEVKEVFEVFSRKMPPVFPRLMATLVERSIVGDLHDIGISIEQVMKQGVTQERNQYISSLENVEIKREVSLIRETLEKHYASLKSISEHIHASMNQIVIKNEQIHYKQLDFLEHEFLKQSKQREEYTIRKYDRVQNALLPKNQPQERLWNIFYFMNKYGPDFVARLLLSTGSNQPFTHKIIYI
ncbi:bacillithiol biosynthesis cysteine-adding enzyme BshC [Bacillus salitolerans]|uniref:Putative cysteine ligase BshC n=1 Tax=Bacillus salitolerans TaxID=1437434 RepID=A0ABW4LNR5_9BACI